MAFIFIEKWSDLGCISLMAWEIASLGLFSVETLYLIDIADVKPLGFVSVRLLSPPREKGWGVRGTLSTVYGLLSTTFFGMVRCDNGYY